MKALVLSGGGARGAYEAGVACGLVAAGEQFDLVCSTSIGANYRAACRARSRAEFASKLGTVAEEADENLYWLELIRDGNFVPEKRIASLVSEGDELTAIFTSGRRSASRPQPSKIKPQTSSS